MGLMQDPSTVRKDFLNNVNLSFVFTPDIVVSLWQRVGRELALWCFLWIKDLSKAKGKVLAMKDQSCKKKKMQSLFFWSLWITCVWGCSFIGFIISVNTNVVYRQSLAVVGLTLEGFQLSWSTFCFLFLIFSNGLNCLFPECLPGQIV